MKKTLILGLLILGGCASVFDGEMQQVSINSNVKGAKIMLNGMPIGKTPFVGRIKRQRNSMLILRKSGYDERMYPLNTSINPVAFANILFGYSATTSSGIDYMTGAGIEYSPNMIYVTMEKK